MSLTWKVAQGTERVRAEDLPIHPEPNGVSEDDHPGAYLATGQSQFADRLAGTYSLRQVPLADLHPDHRHDADCYLPTKGKGCPVADVADDEYEGENYDHAYVKGMARDVDALPLLLGGRMEDGRVGYFGGGHRSAAHAEAGRTHIKMWMRDR